MVGSQEFSVLCLVTTNLCIYSQRLINYLQFARCNCQVDFCSCHFSLLMNHYNDAHLATSDLGCLPGQQLIISAPGPRCQTRQGGRQPPTSNLQSPPPPPPGTGNRPRHTYRPPSHKKRRRNPHGPVLVVQDKCLPPVRPVDRPGIVLPVSRTIPTSRLPDAPVGMDSSPARCPGA